MPRGRGGAGLRCRGGTGCALCSAGSCTRYSPAAEEVTKRSLSLTFSTRLVFRSRKRKTEGREVAAIGTTRSSPTTCAGRVPAGELWTI